jgi:hypothetical protein
MSELFLALIIGLLAKVVIDEVGATIQALARSIVKRGAQLLPDGERYEEQWLADLNDRPTPVRKMFFALGILWAATVLRRESALRPTNARRDYAAELYFWQKSPESLVKSAAFEKALAQKGIKRSKRVMLRVRALYELALTRDDLTPEQHEYLREFLKSLPEDK